MLKFLGSSARFLAIFTTEMIGNEKGPLLKCVGLSRKSIKLCSKVYVTGLLLGGANSPLGGGGGGGYCVKGLGLARLWGI